MFSLLARVADEEFSSAEITPTYDASGNLTFDGTYKHTYNALALDMTGLRLPERREAVAEEGAGQSIDGAGAVS